MERRFVVISGLPGSGKTTLSRRLGPALGLSVIDKDEILEELFAAKGVGGADLRRVLSRESDAIFEARAKMSGGAILVSFWRRPGMPGNSGTPTEWISELSTRMVHLHCVCPVEVAAERFLARRRHPGHLDGERSRAEAVQQLRTVARLEPISIGQRIDVDTTREVDLDALLHQVNSTFGNAEKLSHKS